MPKCLHEENKKIPNVIKLLIPDIFFAVEHEMVSVRVRYVYRSVLNKNP